MSERRPHWDDDLIEAAFEACPQLAFEREVYPVIAAVEDWQAKINPSGIAVWEHAPKGTLRQLERKKVAIQRVREVLDENANSYVTKAKICRPGR